MKYKTSQFNITVPVERSDEVILFNTKECSFVVLDKKNKSFLTNIDDISTYEEDVVSNLIELGFLVDENLDEIENLKQQTKKARISSESLSLTIATTLDCNMNCYYCFEKKNQQYLSTDVADKIINYIFERLSSGQFKKLLIVWTGGEPLLNKNIIEYISTPIIQFCSDKEIEYHGSIITNGLLLNEETVKFLKNMHVRDGQVTVDGLEKTHNERRLSVDNLNSFQIIIDNIKTAYKYLSIGIRVNIDCNNKNEIKDLLDYLYKSLDYNNNNNLSVILAQVNGCTTTLPEQEYFEFLRDIFNMHITDSKLEKNYPVPLNFACGVQCKDSLVIAPDGYVYKCWEEIGIKEFSIGTIEKINDDCKINQKYLADMWPIECDGCTYLPMCHGGCPMRRGKNNNKPLCASQAKTLDIYLKRYYKLWEKENEATS